MRILHLRENEFPVTKEHILDRVQVLLKNLKRETCFTDNRRGRHWFDLLMRTHTELSQRVSQNLTNKARVSVTQEVIRKWFDELTNHLKKNIDLLDDAARIFNCGETTFFLIPN